MPPLLLIRPWLPLLAILLAAAGAFLQTGHFQFIDEWDDRLYILNNRHVLNGLSWDGALWAFTSTVQACNWHPLTWLSLMGDVSLFGVNPGAMHLMAVGLHLLNTTLVYLFFQRATLHTLPAAIIAGLFALHPLHVESVTWLSERKDLLSAGFWFLTMLLYLEYARHGGMKRYLLTLAAFTLGLLAKPMLVTLPFVLLLLDYWPLGRLSPAWNSLKRLLWEKLPFFLLAAGSSAITLYVQSHCGAVIEITTLPVGVRIENALVSYVLYLERTLWPQGLAFFYPHPHNHPGTLVALSACFLASITALAVQQAKRRPWLPVGWFFYLGTLVPVIGLIQVGSQGLADRYTYIPLTGIFLILAMLVREHPWSAPAHPARPLLLGAVVALLAVMGVASHTEAGYWKDRETLYRRAIAVTEKNYLAHAQLAAMYENNGNLDEALRQARQALAYAPNSGPSHITMGNVYRKRRELIRAEEHYAKAIELDPSSRTPYYNMGIIKFERNRMSEAEYYFRKGLEVDPEDAEAMDNLGATLYATGRKEEALALFQQAVRMNPDIVNARLNLVRTLEYFQRTEETLPHFAHVVALEPREERVRFHYGKALLQTGRTQEARQQLSVALSLAPGRQDTRALLERAGGVISTTPQPSSP